MAFYEQSLYLYNFRRNTLSDYTLGFSVTSAAWLPDGHHLLIQTTPVRNSVIDQIFLFDLLTNNVEMLYQGRIYGDIRVSPDGNFVAFQAQRNVTILEIKTGYLHQINHSRRYGRLQWSSDSQYLAIASIPTISIFDISQGSLRQTLPVIVGNEIDIFRWTNDNDLIYVSYNRDTNKTRAYLSLLTTPKMMETFLSASSITILDDYSIAYASPNGTEIQIINWDHNGVITTSTLPAYAFNYFGEEQVMYFHWLP